MGQLRPWRLLFVNLLWLSVPVVLCRWLWRADLPWVSDRFLLGAWLLVNVLDVVSTVMCLRLVGSTKQERSVTARWLMGHLGIFWGTVANKVLLVPIYTLAWWQAKPVLALFTLVFVAIDYSNFRQWRIAHREARLWNRAFGNFRPARGGR